MPTAPPVHRLSRRAKREHRPAPYARGYGSRQWARLRKIIYTRDAGKCKMCGSVVAGRQAHIDHIVPKAQGGQDELVNLQLLCVSCHSAKTVRESTGVRVYVRKALG